MNLSFLRQSSEQRRDLILHGSIAKTLILLSFPTLMLGVVQSLMPLSDGLFINNVSGTLVASAVSYSQPVINTALALSQGIGTAAMALLGQMNGRGSFGQSRHIATQIIVFAFALGCIAAPIIALLSIPIANNISPEIMDNVRTYIGLYSLVIPFAFLEAIYNAIKNASGKPEATFIRMVLMLALKILFNFVFIVWLRLDVVGCVLASLCANVIVCGWMFFELFLKKSEEQFTLKGFRFDWQVLGQLIKIGIPSMLTSVLLNFGFFLINNEVQKYGAIALNGQGIANSITQVCFNLPSAFGAAVTTMVSMNVGAGMGARAKRCCFVGCIASAITAVVIIAIIVPLAPFLTVLFTRVPEVLDMANQSLNIYTYSVVGFGVCMVQQGAFIGLGRTKVPLFTGILRVWLLRYLFILATEQFLGVFAVFWGNLFSNYMAAIITTILILRVKWVSVINLDSSQKGGGPGLPEETDDNQERSEVPEQVSVR